MPFQAYASYFSSEELKALRKTYTATLNDVSAEMLALPPDKTPALKQKLARLILASACNKKRDADELKETALRGFRTAVRRRTQDLKAVPGNEASSACHLNEQCD